MLPEMEEVFSDIALLSAGSDCTVSGIDEARFGPGL
jgi:hypothetical protein